MSPVVDVEGLTTGWLSSVLERDARLLSCEPIGTGQTSATYRLGLDAAGLPASVVAKVAAGDPAARKRVRNGARSEVGFYRLLRPTVDVRAPRCWYAAIADDALRFTLILEDLAPRVPGVQADGCPRGRAGYAVDNLAGLHASRWNDETLFDAAFLHRPGADGAAFIGTSAIAATEVFVDRYRADLSAADVGTLRASAAATESWLLGRPGPFALLHGDYRLDNLMFGTAEHDIVAVDWQTAVVGPPARDVAYFLGTCLHIDERRAAEEDLVRGYHARLVAHGVSYPADDCYQDYRLGQLQGPMITTIGAAYASAARSAQSDAMFLAMARRSCAAIRDLGSLDLL